MDASDAAQRIAICECGMIRVGNGDVFYRYHKQCPANPSGVHNPRGDLSGAYTNVNGTLIRRVKTGVL